MLCIIAFSAYRNWAQLAPFLLGRYLWAAASVGVVLLMISGRMWVQIRNAPFAARDGYIAGGYSNQYGIEVYIIAAICAFDPSSLGRKHLTERTDAVLAFAAYTIAVILPQNKNPSIQRIGVYVWCAVLVSVHSILVSIFKTKNPGVSLLQGGRRC
jgi:oligosaccharyltransferase complex subunit gamma